MGHGEKRRGVHGLVAAGLLLPASPALAAPLIPTAPGQAVVLSALAAGGIALGLAGGLWALAEQSISRRLRRSLRLTGAGTRAAVGERDGPPGGGRARLGV